MIGQHVHRARHRHRQALIDDLEGWFLEHQVGVSRQLGLIPDTNDGLFVDRNDQDIDESERYRDQIPTARRVTCHPDLYDIERRQ